tara:strand:- start:604 stop:801 length:198 start_codon:yes stop_codon:yes gene_type:complete
VKSFEESHKKGLDKYRKDYNETLTYFRKWGYKNTITEYQDWWDKIFGEEEYTELTDFQYQAKEKK